jgi:hypothetical protein
MRTGLWQEVTFEEFSVKIKEQNDPVLLSGSSALVVSGSFVNHVETY